jgi:branched-chain amino acid transport system substrate-binding protein
MASLKFIRAAALALAGAAAAFPAAAQDIRIGYAISRTGPFAAGAQISQEPNYIMWAEQVNAAGGLNVGGKKRKIELIGYDDRSEVETMVRTYEKLMGSDKVDLILPPWGTGMNFALMPLAQKHRYPMLSPTATGRRLLGLKNPYFFPLLQQPDVMMNALAEFLKARGTTTAAVIHVDELFGLEQATALEKAFKEKGIQIVEKKSYPIGVKDLQPVLRDIKDKNPGAFIALSYPPDTFLITGQSKALAFNPSAFYAAVGSAFPVYRDKMGASTVQGVMGLGTWNPKSGPAAKAYFDAHVKRWNKEPDRWASAHAGPACRSCSRPWRRWAGSREDPRLHRQPRVRHDHRQDPLQERREREHPGRRQPVGGRRVRGGVAAAARHGRLALSRSPPGTDLKRNATAPRATAGPFRLCSR